MRVLMLEPSGWGGIAHYSHALCTALAQRGAHVRLITNVHRDDLTAFTRNYEFERLICGDTWLAEWRRLRAAIRDFQPHIFHMQAPISSRRDAAAFYWHRLCRERSRYVVTAHNILPHETERFETLSHRWLYRLADGLIVHSEASRRRLLILMHQRLVTPVAAIHQGHYCLLFKDKAWNRNEALELFDLPQSRYILCFGAVRPYKGVDWLIEAVAAMNNWPDDLRVLVAGPLLAGVNREDLEHLAASLGVEDRIHFRLRYHPEDHIPALFAIADLVALPYRDIDQSGVLMAALAAGKPVVCTPVGGFPEVVNKDIGFMADQVNLQSFAQALELAIAGHEKWQDMGNRAAQMVTNQWSWEAAAAATIAFYQSLYEGIE